MRKKWSLFAAVALAAMGGAYGTACAQEQAAGPARPAPAKVDTAVFAELPMLVDPRISPDGKRVAAQLAVQGKQYFAIVGLDDGAKPLLIGTGDTDLNEWHWVNNDWLVLGVGRTTPVDGDEWYIKRAFGVNAATGKMVLLNSAETGQDGGSLLWIAHDGTPRVLLAAQTSIFTNDAGFWPKVDEVDVSTGRHKTVLTGREGVMSWYADGAGVVRMGIGRSMDGRQRRLLYRPTGPAISELSIAPRGCMTGCWCPRCSCRIPARHWWCRMTTRGSPRCGSLTWPRCRRASRFLPRRGTTSVGLWSIPSPRRCSGWR